MPALGSSVHSQPTFTMGSENRRRVIVPEK